MRTIRSALSAVALGAALALLPHAESLAQTAVTDIAAERQQAEAASARGDHAGAEAAYDRLLAQRPDDAATLVARGNARAFQKKYAAAIADFDAVLARQPNHLGALVGLAHALAWSGRHADALAQFERALAVAPGNVDAQRGAAYTELWRGNAAASAKRFERLLAQSPQDADAAKGLAEARAALAPKGPRFEVIGWFGRSKLPLGQNETGLRLAEFALWPTERLRLFARYDDGLARDNAALAQADRGSALKSIGVYNRWGERHGTMLELGSRSFPGGVDQQIYRVEQSLYLDGGHELKGGGWFGPRSDDRDEWLVHVGGGVAFAPGWRFEPTLFYARNGQPGGNEWRALLAANHAAGGNWEYGGGIASGRAHDEGQDRQVREVFARVGYALTPSFKLHALARRESVSGGDAISVLALGAAFSWR